MASTLKGATAVWFMEDTSFKAGNAVPAGQNALVGLTGVLNMQSTQGTRGADQSMVKNSTGDVIAEGYNHDNYQGTFEAVPTGTDAADLETGYRLPKPGQRIEVVEEVNAVGTFIGGTALVPKPYIVDKVDWRGDLSSARALVFSIHRVEHDTSGLYLDAAS